MGSTAIYKAFIKAGVDEDTAMAAANDIATSGQVTTESDMSELKVRLIKWMVSLHLATIALVVASIKLL